MKKLGSIFVLLALAACARMPAQPNITSKAPVPPSPRSGRLQFPGMPVGKLRAELGAPAFVRKDGASQMWRYDGAACHAFFFLYGAGAAQAVRHVETLPRGKAVVADPACLKTLRKVS